MRRTMSGVLAAALIAAVGLLACGDSGTNPDPDPDPGPTTGTVTGTVQASGEPVEGATVTLGNVGTATTNSSGGFTFSDVEAGTYTITLTVPTGLELNGEQASKSVTVTAGQIAPVNWSLRDPDAPVIQEVRLSGVSFSPQDVTIAPGTTVRWIVDSGGPHTVTPDDPDQTGVWEDSGSLNNGAVFEHTFNTGGQTYDYHCTPHLGSGMVGSITVSS